MFWKLWKFEMKSSYRGYFMTYACLLLCSVLLCLSGKVHDMDGLTVNLALSNSQWGSFLFAFISISFVITIFAVIIMTMVNIVRGYLKSMFGRQGYLTHTLPVTQQTLLTVKLLSAVVWVIATTLVVSVSFFILFLPEIEISDMLRLLNKIFLHPKDMALVYSSLLYMIVSLLEEIALLYLVLNFAHSCYIQRHRGIVIVASFIIVNYAVDYADHFVRDMMNIRMLESVSANLFLSLFSLILLALYVFGSIYLLKHKMEVE